MLLEQDPFSVIRRDSASVSEGEPVTFRLKIDEPGIFALQVGVRQNIVCIIQPGENIHVEADIHNFPGSIRVEGSPETQWLQNFYAYSEKNKKRVDSLQTIMEESQFDPDFFATTLRLDSLFSTIWENQRAYEKKVIHEKPASLASLLILHYNFGAKVVLSVHDDSTEYLLVDRALKARYPNNKHTLFFQQWLQEVK